MSSSTFVKLGLIFVALLIFGVLLYQIPAINSRLSWRVDVAMTYLRNVINPVGQMPTPLPQPVAAVTLYPTETPTVPPANLAFATSSPEVAPTRTPVPTSLPQSIDLGSPSWEKQTPNNCGPAT